MFVAAMSPYPLPKKTKKQNARPETPQLICTVTHTKKQKSFVLEGRKPEDRGDQSTTRSVRIKWMGFFFVFLVNVFPRISLISGDFASAPSHWATEGHTCLRCAVVRRVRCQARTLLSPMEGLYRGRGLGWGWESETSQSVVSAFCRKGEKSQSQQPSNRPSLLKRNTGFHRIVLRKAQEEEEEKQKRHNALFPLRVCSHSQRCVCVCVCVCVMAFLAVVQLIELEGPSSISLILPHLSRVCLWGHPPQRSSPDFTHLQLGNIPGV